MAIRLNVTAEGKNIFETAKIAREGGTHKRNSLFLEGRGLTKDIICFCKFYMLLSFVKYQLVSIYQHFWIFAIQFGLDIILIPKPTVC